MGYTHYWSRPKTFTVKSFTAAAADCERVVKSLKCQVQRESDDTTPAVFSRDSVRFNGVGDAGHETFAIPRVFTRIYEGQKSDKDGWSDFCKTAAKPYDLAVCACLVVFKHHYEEKFIVASDGDDGHESWPEARAACHAVLGYGRYFSLKTQKRFDVKGLGLGRHGIDSSRGCSYRRFDNGWELYRPNQRWSYEGWGPNLYKVIERSRGTETPICAADTINDVRWLATCHHILAILNEPPENPFVRSAMQSEGDWTSFLVWADFLDEAADPRGSVLRAILPKFTKPK